MERQELVDIPRKEDDTPAAAIAIGGLAVNINVEGQPENFDGQTLQREEGAAGSSAGGSVADASPMSFSPGPSSHDHQSHQTLRAVDEYGLGGARDDY